jgi:hypothetical protein
MAFEVYYPRRRSKKEGKAPIVSLSKNSIVLSKMAREKLNSPEYIELAFDKDSDTIRIGPSNMDEGNALKKTKVIAKGFFDHFDLDLKGKYNANYDSEENALFVGLRR